jgi:Spy/CpxP family protein refolding chaperone
MTITRIPAAVLLAAALSAAFAADAFAVPGRPLAPAGPAAIVLEAIERLDLSAAQRAEIRDIVGAHREELRGELAAVRSARSDLFDQIHADAFDEAAVRAQAAAVAAAEAELAVTRAGLVHELRAVLTEEQRQEVAAMRDTAKSLVGTVIDAIVARLTAFEV